MVTLQLIKLLENNGFGTIDEDLFWEKMGVGEEGLYISDLGSSNNFGSRKSVTYQIYSRGKTDVEGYKQLEKVMDFINNHFTACNLPAVPPIIDYEYRNVTLMPTSSISSAGEDINGRMIYSLTGQIYLGHKVKPQPPDPPLPSEGTIATENNQEIITENNKLLEME